MNEKEQGMPLEELEDMSNFAAKLFDELNLRGLTIKDAFVLGFLRGREFTLEQLGVWEDDDDDDAVGEPPEIIKKYLEHDQNK